MTQIQRIYCLVTASIWLVSFAIVHEGSDYYSNPAWAMISPLRWILLIIGFIWLGMRLWSLFEPEYKPDTPTVPAPAVELLQPKPAVAMSKQDNTSIERLTHERERAKAEALRIEAERKEAEAKAEIERIKTRSAKDAAQAALHDFL